MLSFDYDTAESDLIPLISYEEERIGQYSTQKRARLMAKIETIKTKRWHKEVPGICFRMNNGVPQKKYCWTVVMYKA